ncbi:MAG: calcineurin-like phosphoesterase C-terminal domain-containing protein, partial [Sphingobacterium sp.]|nr:calcineurin-like phosphoesterase C-terminal domain-containing protein [Sphingobacterium sp.]
LKLVPKNTTIVLSQHIPMAHTHNQKEVLALLKEYQKVLILTGHTHTVNRYFFKHDNIHELGAGATCGNWWRGEKGMDGVPQALMQCGTPRGYFTVDFQQGDYQVNYKGVGMDEKYQMDLVVETTGLVLNVFGGSEKTKVELQIDDSQWMDMQQQKRVAPSVQAIRDKNQEKIYPTLGNTRNPLGTRVSSHIWGLELPEAYKGKIVKVKIRAKDDFGFSAEQEFITKL